MLYLWVWFVFASCTCTNGCNEAFPAILILQHLLHSSRLQESMQNRCTVSIIQVVWYAENDKSFKIGGRKRAKYKNDNNNP